MIVMVQISIVHGMPKVPIVSSMDISFETKGKLLIRHVVHVVVGLVEEQQVLLLQHHLLLARYQVDILVLLCLRSHLTSLHQNNL